MATTAKYQSDIKTSQLEKESSFFGNCISPDSSRCRSKAVATPFPYSQNSVSSHHLEFSQARVKPGIENFAHNSVKIRAIEDKLSDRFIPIKNESLELTETQTLRADTLEPIDE